jgi:O-antigen ligase
MRKTIKSIFAEYGTIGVVVYFAIFFLVLFGFWAAIRFGWQPSSAAANLGIWTAAYIATKLTQPVRIIATLAVTPFVAKLYERVTRRARGT